MKFPGKPPEFNQKLHQNGEHVHTFPNFSRISPGFSVLFHDFPKVFLTFPRISPGKSCLIPRVPPGFTEALGHAHASVGLARLVHGHGLLGLGHRGGAHGGFQGAADRLELLGKVEIFGQRYIDI